MWNTVICHIGSFIRSKSTTIKSCKGQIIAVKIAVPTTLIIRWIKAVLFAFTPAPMLAKVEVIQVPIVAPSTIYIALSTPITFPPTITITIPVAADEDCISAVNTTPTTISRCLQCSISTLA